MRPVAQDGRVRRSTIAYAALFLHSDEARFITGVSLPVDGGASASFGSYE